MFFFITVVSVIDILKIFLIVSFTQLTHNLLQHHHAKYILLTFRPFLTLGGWLD